MQDITDDDTMNMITNLLENSKYGYSIADLSKMMGLNRNTVSKYLHILLMLGQVDYHVVGPSRVFNISQRLPVSMSYLKTLPSSAYIADMNGKILWTNKYFLDEFANSGEIVGNKIQDLNIGILEASAKLTLYNSAVMGKANISSTWEYLNIGDKRYRLWISPVVFSKGIGVLVLIETQGYF